MKKLRTAEELTAFRENILQQRDPNKPCVAVCMGAGCLALGSNEVMDAFVEEIKKQGLEDTPPGDILSAGSL